MPMMPAAYGGHSLIESQEYQRAWTLRAVTIDVLNSAKPSRIIWRTDPFCVLDTVGVNIKFSQDSVGIEARDENSVGFMRGCC